ncbi:MAG: ABC transporter ATP-binding protein [Oscillatoria sp. SIO1A7]|nr:ABC transporter ATP-binding protein [Oscillatoria sp. SIO1A7]
MSKPLLDLENLRIAYPGQGDKPTWAVDGVSLSLAPGERLGLVGESGCGKSTLGRAVMRLLPSQTKVEGQAYFQGKSIFDLRAEALRRFRGEAIALIFQDPMTRLDPLMTIGEHCLETLLAHQPHLSRKEAKKIAVQTLETVKIPPERWSQYPHEFSGGMRQRVAIALALLLDPKLIVADEPTTSLDVTVSAEILQELTRLCRDRDMALLLISHDLAMVGEYCDRIAVMYGGLLVELGKTESVLQNPQHEYTRSLLQAALHIQAVDTQPESPELKIKNSEAEANSSKLKTQNSKLPNPLLCLEELQQYYSLEVNFIERLFFAKKSQTIKAVDGVSLELYPGEILGLVGESGCGKSTLSRTVLQLVRPTGGKVEFLGRDLTKLSNQSVRQLRRQMQMVFQDPHACLNPMMTVGQSIIDPLLIHRLASPAEAKTKVEKMLERVGLTPVEDYYNRYPGQLSGGQQQRVAIARALIVNPQLVICDEPVSMLDASVQTQVLELMLELKEEFDLTYLFITHDLWVARFFCDRIAVMNSGRIVEIGRTHDIFTNPQHPYTQTLLAAAPLLAKA